ncbi:MAG: hypothetical protein MZU91_10195 [Desulfosudis oleivorans]|nr:hypothetical protein [Desulfosudis oleivorans]
MADNTADALRVWPVWLYQMTRARFGFLLVIGFCGRDAQAYTDNPGAAITTHPIAQPVTHVLINPRRFSIASSLSIFIL